MTLTAEVVRSLLCYDIWTGDLTWRHTQGRILAGSKAGAVTRGYINISVQGRRYLAHRIIWLWMTGKWPAKEMIDHINGNKGDNRWANLREATRSQNCLNSRDRPRSSTNARGVYLHKATGLWLARIYHQGRVISLGYHRDREEAIAIRNAASLRINAEFGRLSNA